MKIVALIGLAVPGLLSCLQETDISPLDPPLRVESIQVTDPTGQPWSMERAPRRPQLIVEASEVIGARLTPRLFSGRLSMDDASRVLDGRVPTSLESELVPISISEEQDRMVIRPEDALRADGIYTLVIEGGEGWIEVLRVARQHAGAVVRETWPADGTSGVPPSILLLAVRFDDEIVLSGDEISLAPIDSEIREPVVVAEDDCAQLGFADGFCVAITLANTLRPHTTYRLHISSSLEDTTGASVGPWSAEFRTGAHEPPSTEPIWSRVACAIDEIAVAVGCALILDDRVALRMQTRVPVRVFVESLHGGAETVASRGHASLEIGGLPASSDIALFVRAVDLASREHLEQLRLTTSEVLPKISITEVRFDPRGPEPAQEFVELTNHGATDIQLTGFALSDRPDKEGDRIESAITLASGGHALLVADRFDPEHPDDAPVPPGTPLVRLGSSLASGGLSNAGEPLFLRDSSGRRISAVPPLPAPRSGLCRVRLGQDTRTGEIGSFGYDSNGSCTPGRPHAPPDS